MPVVLLLILIVVVVLVMFLGVTLAYLFGKGLARLGKALTGSALPRSVTQSVAESRHYGRLIMQVAQQYPPGPMRDRLNLTLKPVGEWLTNLTRLEQGLARLYHQRNLPRELRRMTFEMDELRRQILTATNEEAKFLQALLQSKKQHHLALKELQLFQTQAELKIRKIASDLATTHAEMLLIVAKGNFNENRFHRLDENLQDHLSSLRDMLAAMDELGYSQAAG